MPTLLSTDANHEVSLLTAEEFLDWLEPGKHADLIDGEIHMHSPVNIRHANLLNFLDELLRRFIRRSKAGGKLYREVVAVRLSSRNVFEPDLSWFSPEQVSRLAESHAPFAPLWVCEALSPRTADRDVGPKFAAYEEHGVQEYWILDPHTFRHRFYARDGEVLVEFAEEGEWIVSKTIPGFKVRRSWLHPDEHPDVDAALVELPG